MPCSLKPSGSTLGIDFVSRMPPVSRAQCYGVCQIREKGAYASGVGPRGHREAVRLWNGLQSKPYCPRGLLSGTLPSSVVNQVPRLSLSIDVHVVAYNGNTNLGHGFRRKPERRSEHESARALYPPPSKVSEIVDSNGRAGRDERKCS